MDFFQRVTGNKREIHWEQGPGAGGGYKNLTTCTRHTHEAALSPCPLRPFCQVPSSPRLKVRSLGAAALSSEPLPPAKRPSWWSSTAARSARSARRVARRGGTGAPEERHA